MLVADWCNQYLVCSLFCSNRIGKKSLNVFINNYSALRIIFTQEHFMTAPSVYFLSFLLKFKGLKKSEIENVSLILHYKYSWGIYF